MSTTEIKNLEFWCQKVLPLVYDDSLSYYELVDKVVSKLNELIDFTQDKYNDFVKQQIQKWLASKYTELAYDEENTRINFAFSDRYITVQGEGHVYKVDTQTMEIVSEDE